MMKAYVRVSECGMGSILAEDIYSNDGIKLAAKDTIINEYIINRLIEMDVDSLWIYIPSDEPVIGDKEAASQRVKEEYIKDVQLIRSVIYDLTVGRGLDYDKISKVTASVYQGINESSFVMECLSKLKNMDEYTYTHSINTAFYAMLIAKWLKLPGKNIREVIEAGLLHDIGKAKVPERILNKPGPLTAEEYDEMKKHPVYGYSILDDEKSVSTSVKEAVLSHHERLDGSGYPNGVCNDSLSLYTKILGIADVFDAITSDRIYKRRSTPFDAFSVFTSIGIRGFDMSIVNTFLNNIVSYYVGVNVLLNNGYKGKIVYIPPYDIVNPVVDIKSNFIDLSKRGWLKIIDIVV